MNAEILLTVKRHNRLFANDRRIMLLKQIDHTGSISQGAKQTGISYKTAWDAINEMNELAGQPVIDSVIGGKGGGGARLTPYSKRLIQLYDLLAQFQQHAFDILQDETIALDSLLGAIARFSLQTSARNQLFATITHIEQNDVKVTLDLLLADQHTHLTAALTQQSAARLQLAKGKQVIALIKAPWVSLSLHPDPNADNQLLGTIQSLQQNSHDSEVMLTIAEHLKLCATVATQHYQQMSLNIGQPVYAHFPAESIIIATLV